MTAQIRPTRMEVSDRFPMLGFGVRTDQPDVEAEIVLASDVSLFSPQNRQSRTAANFYSSREHGSLTVPRGEGVFVVPPEVLARFIGNEKLFFGLATGKSGNGGLQVDALPREGSPYVSLRGFTGRTLRRGFGNARASTPKLDWTGDAPRPGSEAANKSNSSSPTSTMIETPAPSEVPYDDGFGPMPEIPARESAYSGPRVAERNGAESYRGVPFTPAHKLGLPSDTTAITMASGMTPQQALAWIREKVEAIVDVVAGDVSPPSLYRLGSNSSTFISAWETVLGASSWLPSGAIFGFLKDVPAIARSTGVTLSVGPALDTPLFGVGVGVVFAPDGEVALFGQGDVSVDFDGLSKFITSLKAALQFKLKLGYNTGGINGFASLAKVASVAVGAEIVVGAEVWLDSSGHGLGGAVSIGAGFSLELSEQDAAQPQIVIPKMPGDTRDRARRIGGEFSPRIGEALDLGLDPSSLTALLDKLDPPATAKPGGLARPMGSTVWSVHWDDVHVIPQPTASGCWAAGFAMLTGWRDSRSYDPSAIAQQCRHDINDGLLWADHADAARTLGLGTLPLQNYSPDGFRDLLERHGPLYVGKIASDTSHTGHAVLVTGMYYDGTDYFVRIADPWDRGTGSPGAPAPYGHSHRTGSKYIMRFDSFMHEYEMLQAAASAKVQIVYAGVPAGRSVNLSTSAPSGYAMAAEGAEDARIAQRVPADALSAQAGIGPQVAVAVGAVIAGAVVSQVGGDITYTLDRYVGWKRPRGTSQETPLGHVANAKATIAWDDGDASVLKTGIRLDITWQHDGWSLGHVDITPHHLVDGWGNSLHVHAQISEDDVPYGGNDKLGNQAVYKDNPGAKLKVTITYRVGQIVRDDVVERKEIFLLPDGSYIENNIAS